MIHERDANGGADAGFSDGTNCFFGHPVHVAEPGRTATDHFQCSELGAGIDVFGTHLAFKWPDVIVEPGKERKVVGVTAQQRH